MKHANPVRFRPLVSPLLLSGVLALSWSQPGVAAVKKPSLEASQGTGERKAARVAKKPPAMVKLAMAPASLPKLAVPMSDAVQEGTQALVAQSPEPSAQPVTTTQAHAPVAPANGPRPNPYLVNMPAQGMVSGATPEPAPADPAVKGEGGVFSGLSLPHVALFDQAILPKVQKVYPTGEKPLVVVTFKCPTELVGIDTPSTLILHKAVNGGMDLINKTNLLSFNMQQVCQ